MVLDGNAPESIARAADALAAGQLIGLPTETVYGLAADAGSDAAVRGIFAAKGRPADHPLIVHVASAAQVSDFADQVPVFAQKLIDAFWPGPLTLILPRRAGVAEAAAGGHAAVGGLRRARRARAGGAQRQPLWPHQPDHGAARGAGIWRRTAGARWRAVRGGHRIDHR